MLLWRGGEPNWLWVFGYAKTGAGDRHERPAYGVSLKLNGRRFGRPYLRQFSIGLYGSTLATKEKLGGRGCWKLEVETWRVAVRGAETYRVGLKKFLRIKACL